MKSGSVAAIRRVKNAIRGAHAVLEHNTHTIIAGGFVTDFAMSNGFAVENLTTADSEASCEDWKADGYEPNYRIDVTPDPSTSSVENLRLRISLNAAAEDDVARMLKKYPEVQSGIVVVNNKGEHGGAGSS
ncbi:nucleophile aminohydrolase [Xylariaceae sp. FL1019]|nr:nucleophile aminohydrolase [Xylariaceae sp. FL1019]